MIPFSGKYDYKKIPELNALMLKVKTSHDKMLEKKKEELFEVVQQCLSEIHMASAGGNAQTKAINEKSDSFYTQQKEKIANATSLALMEGFPIPMWNYRDDVLQKIEVSKMPPKSLDESKKKEDAKQVIQKTYKPIFRQSLLKAARLENEDDIDEYVDRLRDQLKMLLKGTDGIELK